MRRSSVSVAEFLAAFPNEQACLEYVFYHRHGFKPHCPRCGESARFKLVSYRRSFISGCCGAFASPTARTVLDHTRIPLRMWFYAGLLYTELSPGLSQNALMRLIGLHRHHAWALADRLRTHIALCEPMVLLGGPGERVFVDETQVRIGPRQERCILLGITDGRRCTIRIVADRSAASLIAPIVEVTAPGSIVVSDGWPAYNRLDALGFEHRRVVHRRKMWVNAQGDCMTYVEGIWANLKRLLSGKSAQVVDANLWKFVAEVIYRYNAALDPAAAWWRLIGGFREVHAGEIEAVRRRIDRRSDR